MSYFLPVIWWLLTLTLAWLCFPVCFRLFKNLPDSGYSLSKVVGLLISGMCLFWLWVFGVARMSQNSLLGILFFAVLAASALRYRKPAPEYRKWASTNLRNLLIIEGLFALAFFGFALFRAHNPDIRGTEKPMEIMFINSILSSDTFPPHDAWLSGHAISYYYFGYFLIATMAKLTGTSPGIAFNLGLAVTFALSAQASMGVALALIGHTSPNGPANNGSRLSTRMIALAMAGPVFLLAAGNLYGVLGILNRNGGLREVQVPAVYYQPPSESYVDSDIPPPRGGPDAGLRSGMVEFWSWLDIKQLDEPAAVREHLLDFSLPNWFFASRVVHDRDLMGNETEAIDEFPAFSFLLGDLHPHVLSLPFTLLAIALAWRLFVHTSASPISWSRYLPRESPILVGLGVPVTLGVLFFLNSWDFPVYWFLLVTAVVVGMLRRMSAIELLLRWIPIIKFALWGLIGGLVVTSGYLISFQSQAGGILPNLVWPTRVQQYLVMFAPMLIILLPWLLWTLSKCREAVSIRQIIGVSLLAIMLPLGLSTMAAAGLLLSGDTGAVLSRLAGALPVMQAFQLMVAKRVAAMGTTILAAFMIGASGSILLRSRKLKQVVSTTDVMALLLVAAGAALTLIPEFVYLRDNFGTRMNTLFKFYFQAWVLWSVAAAYAVATLLSGFHGSRRLAALLVCSVSVGTGLLYSVPAGHTILDQNRREPTLDGMLYFARAYPDDWKAIQWLNENAEDEAVILEGTRGAYWVEGRSSRISMATGNPTVMGWANHEAQWRGDSFAVVQDRPHEIMVVYQAGSWETAREILDKYNVRYVLVSDLERGWYRPLNERKFEANMLEVFRSGHVTIYAWSPY